MALVDLRGREGEPAVRSLIGHAAGSPESVEGALARYRAGAWILVGWEEHGEVVACAGVARDANRDVELHSVAVAPERRGQGVGRALVDALADAATAARLVAETDADAACFYERCGFAVEPAAARGGRPRYRCVRELTTAVAPAGAVSAVTLEELERAVRESWSRDTSDDPDEWSDENPAVGQCGVTALVVRELLGGEILIANVVRRGERIGRHAWNRLASGVTIDLTRSQFVAGEELGEPVVGEPMASCVERYERLAARIRAALAVSRGGPA